MLAVLLLAIGVLGVLGGAALLSTPLAVVAGGVLLLAAGYDLLPDRERGE